MNVYRSRLAVFVGVVVILSCVCPTSEATWTFYDETFFDTNWTMTPLLRHVNAQTAFQVLDEGNPGACREVDTLANSFEYFAHINEDFVIDPSAGKINWVRFSIDYKSINRGHALTWVLKQDGTYYRPSQFTSSPWEENWRTFESPDPLFQDDFGRPGGSHLNPNFAITPDFTTEGAPIYFGFLTGNSHGSGVKALYDNFEVTVKTPQFPSELWAGDADVDYDFDQFDLLPVLLANKYLSGAPATWGEGDWDGAPGGTPTAPPPGDGFFNQLDILAALIPAHYMQGEYGAVMFRGEPDDSQTSIVYDANTGELAVDAPMGVQLTSINVNSAAGIFTGDPAKNLGGSFDNAADTNIFKATFGGSFGSLSFGNVAQPGLSEDFVLNDLTVIGSLEGGGELGAVDLVYVPEPGTAMLLVLGSLVALSGRCRLRRARR